MIRCLYLLVFCLVCSSLLAQEYSESVSKSSVLSPLYVEDYSNLLVLKFFGINKSNKVAHYDNWTQSYVDYKPNENFNVGLGFSYKWLAADFALNFPFINNDNEIFGKTRRFDIQLSMYLRRFTIDFNYQRYKGYYGSNPATYIPGFTLQNPDYPLRPDISTFNTAVNVLYVFKPEKFSYKAAFTYNERQIKSAGSWLAGTFLSYYTMNGDSILIPHQLRTEFNPSADFRRVKYINTGISGGYGHTFVIGKKVFFSITMALGMGPSFKSSPDSNFAADGTEVKFAVRGIGRISLGYNSDRFFVGMAFISSGSSEANKEEPHLARQVQNFKIFVGRRFNPPGFLKKIGL